ncbi:MAG: ATP phosphoribosyltransferase regulatory subunit [Oscillospiraceae bacterium]|nr:ATP phosphoribosyltransferase regulatory subunit [Oscillospiraceae bacterium]
MPQFSVALATEILWWRGRHGIENMKKNNLITPEGTRDLLFDECLARRKIETDLMSLFKSKGFSEVVTPLLEFYDVFDNYFTQEQMYKLPDAKGRLMVLRPDSTLPIIRLAETRLRDEPRPLRLCYNQVIYRANPKEAGVDDEIAQCGIELIGGSSAGILKLAVEVFKTIGGNYRFELGNCRIFSRLAKEYKIDPEKAELIRRLVETKNYSGLSALDIPAIFVELPKLFGGFEVFEKAEKLFKTETMKNRLMALKRVYTELCEYVKGDKITVDLGLTNELGYYTGIIFNGYSEGFGEPVLTGGKYKVGNTLAAGFAVNISELSLKTNLQNRGKRYISSLVCEGGQ